VKLADIDPHAVALDVARQSHAHVVDLTSRLLSPICDGPWLPRGQPEDAALRSTQIYLTVRDLAACVLADRRVPAPCNVEAPRCTQVQVV